MKVIASELGGVLAFEPTVHGDSRGFFFESYREDEFRRTAGTDRPFVQDNLSRSVRGTLRGLHFQEPKGQGKLVQVFSGEVFDVAVDVRVGSPHFGRWTGVLLTGENRRQMWIPPGFAHGFCAL